jgi:hypothetical protein
MVPTICSSSSSASLKFLAAYLFELNIIGLSLQCGSDYLCLCFLGSLRFCQLCFRFLVLSLQSYSMSLQLSLIIRQNGWPLVPAFPSSCWLYLPLNNLFSSLGRQWPLCQVSVDSLYRGDITYVQRVVGIGVIMVQPYKFMHSSYWYYLM